MPSIKISQAKEGMALSSDAKNDNGQLLIKSGVTLTERHLSLLKSWGVTEIEVSKALLPEVAVGGPPSENDKERLLKLQDARNQLMGLMVLNKASHPLFLELIEICVKRKAKVGFDVG
jgi:hypothetical protein